MSEEQKPSEPSPPRSLKLDLSTGKAGAARAKRKGPPPVVQKTINLSTRKVAPEPKQPGPAKPRAKHVVSKPDTKRKPPSSGTSLADLLDPETLARLRGNG